ncbi:DUF2157 domain-containing protein [Gordonia sp. X0973]|uniref:DUF2157 domain-containing protein n=1 Tax=Gordonia sp. X0973 TaxID=2742602 RepID=UPI0013EE2493|nr:DUF2157 domain-containing protein [Gordonia sp. X0973]QKT05795.1 DUF2157 domain-containing protein [Gordonia sp. X0973]
MADYRERVVGDVDRWIGAGLIDPDNRAAILATLPARRRVDAVTALIWVAAVLLGLAVIAFVAANWDGIARIVRFGLLLAAFLLAAAVGAEAVRRGRTVVADIALTVATLVFAATIGLTGQIYDLTGHPPAVPYGSGAAALAFALVGRSRGALAVGVAAVFIGDVMAHESLPLPISLVVAPLALVLGLRWGSALVAHVASVAVLGVAGWFAGRYDLNGWALLGIAAVLALLAAGSAVVRRGESQPVNDLAIPTTWFAIGALGFFIAAGYTGHFGDHAALGLAHRVVWIAISAGLIALGRYVRHGVFTGLGVLSLIGAVCALLNDLGLDLLVISLVFLGCSFVALVVGLTLRRGRRGLAGAEIAADGQVRR